MKTYYTSEVKNADDAYARIERKESLYFTDDELIAEAIDAKERAVEQGGEVLEGLWNNGEKLSTKLDMGFTIRVSGLLRDRNTREVEYFFVEAVSEIDCGYDGNASVSFDFAPGQRFVETDEPGQVVFTIV